MTLACLMAVCLAACGGDDSDEPAVDELLSTATTQVEFRLPNDRHTYTMYDCAGNHLVGTYTTADGEKCTLSLRQGKHHIVWFMDFNNESVKYEPEGNALTAIREDGMTDYVYYDENDLEVSPYAVEMQYVSCLKEATCQLIIVLTDVAENLSLPDGNRDIKEVGKVTGLPLVRTASLSENKYKTDGDVGLKVYTSYQSYRSASNPNSDGIYVRMGGCQMLCPKDGLNDIQLNVEVRDADGRAVPTTQLPRFSLQRRHRTILCGPLFSGSTSDWKVDMEDRDD